MQITVIGAGNMGCLYGANFARAGEGVAMIDVWEEHVHRIQKEGLDVDGLHGSFIARVMATTEARSAPKSDMALVCVNAYSTREAANSARILLKESGFAVTLQNGLGNVEILTEVLGEHRVMAGLSFHSAELRGPGQVTHTNEGPTYVGELDKSRSSRLSALCRLLDRAGMNSEPVDDIWSTIWGKFVHNCGINAICAITGLRPGQMKEVPALDRFQQRIIGEVLALIEAKGIRIPDADPLGTIQAYCAKKFHRVSMLQHLERNCLTEIDALNGYVVRESERLGLVAPYNDALTCLIKGRQHRAADEAES
jgi:2-dehydropantoate 2-reductase